MSPEAERYAAIMLKDARELWVETPDREKLFLISRWRMMVEESTHGRDAAIAAAGLLNLVCEYNMDGEITV